MSCFARWLSPLQLLEIYPELPTEGLKGGWQFWDGQMAEEKIRRWMQQQAIQAGVVIHEVQEVVALNTIGLISISAAGQESRQHERRFDLVVNTCGPWAGKLLARSGIDTDVRLDLVRGTHLLVPPAPGQSLPSLGLFVEVTGSQRIAFMLIYLGQLLVGTTEETQDPADPIEPSQQDRELLLELVKVHLFSWESQAREQGSWFACVRVIVQSSGLCVAGVQGCGVSSYQRVISVFGGSKTIDRALADDSPSWLFLTA